MARTHSKWLRIYAGGYDVSGYSRMIGPLACTFDEGIDDVLTRTVKQVYPGNASISAGTLNGLFDNTATTGIHALLSGAGVARNVMVAFGMGAAPVDNVPVFCGQFLQGGYTAGGDENPIAVSIPFGNTHKDADNLQYAQPWGALLWALAAKTAANTATGLDQLAATTKGGWMMYQVTAAAGAGNMTATIKVQHASTNLDGSFADLLSSGVINCVNGGVSGIVQLEPGTTVNRYVRPQIALGTATSVTVALAFMRNYV